MTTPGSADPPSELHAHYQRLLQRLEANEREFRRLGRAVWRVQEDERRRLARELHDGLGQNLTALKHRLGQIGSALAPEQAALRDKLDVALALCATALDDTRQLSRLLRPAILDDLGLEPALQWLARGLQETRGIAVVVEIGALPAMDGELRTLVFRVAQEALNNVGKHANAQSVLLRLVERAGRLELQVIDDGHGFETRDSTGGSGLGGMRERLRLHGGELDLRSSPGHGTRLRASIPLDGG